MKRNEWLKMAASLLEKNGVPDPYEDAVQILMAHLKCERVELLLSLGEPVDERLLEEILQKRCSREPLQYLLKTAWFWGRPFYVDSRVLIPRFDTEILCEEALNRIGQGASVLDIGTGSGALAVTVACERPAARVTAVDISEEALQIATENAQRLKADVRFLQSDLFENLTDCVFDMIISNPPYIPSRELSHLQEEVMREPVLALDGGEDGLEIYRRIRQKLPYHLRCGGSLLFEVGDGEAEAVRDLFCLLFNKSDIKEDLSGLSRTVTFDGYRESLCKIS